MESLKFKVILGTPERREAFFRAVKSAGVNGHIVDADFIAGANFAWWDYDFLEKNFVYNTQSFCSVFEDCDYPLIKLDEAIARLEKYAASLQPEFPFKPLDKIIRSPNDCYGWLPDFFSHYDKINLYAVGTSNGIGRLAKFEGNEQYIANANNPPEWWEIKEGKPVLVKRGK